jgi:hypothetical protein
MNLSEFYKKVKKELYLQKEVPMRRDVDIIVYDTKRGNQLKLSHLFIEENKLWLEVAEED